MRHTLTNLLLFFVGMGAVWIWAGSQVSSLLDRFFTVPIAEIPLGDMEISTGELILGQRRWLLQADMRVVPDANNRITVQTGERSFTFGPIHTGRSAMPGAHFRFTPDRGDVVSFTQTRSALAWPAPFRYSIMGAPRASWRRHSYSGLLWKKASGATLELVWRDEQGYFPGTGWTDGNLQIAPRVTISP